MRFISYFLLLIALPALADQAVAGSPQSGGEPTGVLLAGAAAGSPQTPVKGTPPDSLRKGGNKGGAVPQKIPHPAAGSVLVLPVASDADFIAAHDAFLAGDTAKLERYAWRLKNSPLEAYVSYYQLRLSLENADAKSLGSIEGAVHNFLSRPDDTPVSYTHLRAHETR